MKPGTISKLAAVFSAVTLFVIYFFLTLYCNGRLSMLATWISTGVVLATLWWCCWACGQRYNTPNAGLLPPGLNRLPQVHPVKCRIFSSEELERATAGFSSQAEIGRGAFGTVYKGTLDKGTVVAIKRAKHAGFNESLAQFINEVSVLSQADSRHLVKLLGCCVDLVQFPSLVYEFVPNGSLQDHLARFPSTLTWAARLNIAVQAAEALKYLHAEATPPILHTDVKSANILLDDCFHARLADFGLSKLVDLDASHAQVPVQGTPGYMDPEYFRNCPLTDKSDVYSFGVVLLELVTGSKPLDLRRSGMQQNLAVRSIPVIQSGNVLDIIDDRLSDTVTQQDLELIRAVAQVATACLAKERVSRPSMVQVLDMLKNIQGSTLQEHPCQNSAGLPTDLSVAS